VSGAWILLAAIGTGSVAAWAAHWRQKTADLLDDPSPAEAAEERRYGRDRYVALPGYPGPDAADGDPGPDIWSATYPAGVLGEHPESPSVPGPLSEHPQDVEDFLTGVLRHSRAAGSDRPAS
jgi:hypothetical protein